MATSMESVLSPANVTFALGIIGLLFTAYNYLRNPQITADKTDALLVQQLSILQKDVANLRDNHVHTLDIRLDQTNDAISKLALEVTRLSTIIDERIPKKNG